MGHKNKLVKLIKVVKEKGANKRELKQEKWWKLKKKLKKKGEEVYLRYIVCQVG